MIIDEIYVGSDVCDSEIIKLCNVLFFQAEESIRVSPWSVGWE